MTDYGAEISGRDMSDYGAGISGRDMTDYGAGISGRDMSEGACASGCGPCCVPSIVSIADAGGGA